MKIQYRTRSVNSCIPRLFLICALSVISACGGGDGGSSTVGGGTGGGTPPTSGGGSDPDAGGGGSPTFSGGISGSGSIRSRIQGFGSIIVNDDEYDTNSAAFTVDGDDEAVQDDLNIGQVISIETNFNNLAATEIEYRASLKAPIDTIVITDILNGEATITSLGQTILTNASSNFQNADLSLFLVGDLIEVSGLRDENQNIVATFIEKKSALAEYKVVGEINNATSTTFVLGSLNVDYSTATLSDFDGASPSDGQTLEVKGPNTNFTAPDQFIASSIELIPNTSVASDDRLEIEGIINRFVSAEDFDVSGVPVTTSETETVYKNGDIDALALGAILEAEGGVNQNGVLEAVEITFKPTNAVRVEADIESLDVPGNTLTALGLVFTIRDSTQFEDESSAGLGNLGLADLNLGDRVELRAFSDGAALIASKIERDDFEAKSSLRGPVTAINATLGTLEILGIVISTDTNTTYEAETEDMELTLNQSEFFARLNLGDTLEADWEPFISTDNTVTALEIEDE